METQDIPKEELEKIENEVLAAAGNAWERPGSISVPLHFTVCSECRMESPNPAKSRCVCDVVTGTALCCRHWIRKRIRERVDEWRYNHPAPKLDLEDFCRI